MKLAALLTNLFKKSGVDLTQKELADLLAIDAEVPDTVAAQVDKGLMNIEAAKNNPEIKKLIRTEALNGVDAKVKEILEEMGIDEADDIDGEKNSYEKIKKLSLKIKETESKKAGATKKEDKDALETKIADLNKELKLAKDSITNKEKEWQDTRNGDLTNFEIQKKLLGKEYALPKEMNADLKVNTAQSAINMALQAKGFKLVRNEQGQLAIVDKDGNKAYSENHEELQVDSFIDGALAQNKLLKVNDQNPEGGGNTRTTIEGGGENKGNQAIVSDIDSQLFK